MKPPPLRISRITFEGVKAFDRALDVAARTLLLGPVGSGKSSVADALRFAALGRVPHLGGRELDTARILRGGRMVVRVALSDGRWFTRSLSRDGQSFRTEARASWLPANATNTAHAGAIRGLFGESDEEAGEHLDLRELLDATPNQRATRIEAMLAATAMKPADAESLLAALVAFRLAGVDESKIPSDPEKRFAAINGFATTYTEPQNDALRVTLPKLTAEMRAGGYAKALEFANNGKRAAAEQVRRKTAARAEIEDAGVAAEAPAATLADLDKRRETATSRQAVLNAAKERGTLAAGSRQSAEAEVSTARAKVGDHDETRRSIAEARADAARWREQAAAIVDPAEVAAPKLKPANARVGKQADADEAEAKGLDEQAAAIDRVPHPAAPKLDSLPSTDGKAAELDGARRTLQQALNDVWTVIEHHAAEALKTMPSGDAREHVRLISELAQTRKPAIPPLRQAVTDAEAALKDVERRAKDIGEKNLAAQQAHDDAVSKWKAERTRAGELRTKATGLRDQAKKARDAEQKRVDGLNADANREHKAAIDARAAAVAANKAKRDALIERAATAEADALADEQAIDAEAADLRAAEARLGGMGEIEPFDLASTDAELSTLATEIDAIDVSKREVAGADARKRELATLAAAIETAQAESAVYVATEWAVLRLRERDLAARGAPILDRMRVFLRAAGRTEEPYLRATKTATDFGWRRGGNELPIEALSGGETVLFAAALAAAVLALREPELAVLIVEAAELGEAAPANAMLAGASAVADGLSNVLVATCAPIDAPEAWATIRMDGAKAPELTPAGR